MPDLAELFKSNVNRLIALNLIAFFLVEAIFAGEPSRLELYFWENPEFGIWQIVTSMFLHGNLMPHLLFNMFALWSFGRILERVWGGRRFLFFYFVCGIAASLVHQIVSQIEFQAMYDQMLAAGLSARDIEYMLVEGVDISAKSAAVTQEMVQALYFKYHIPAVGASGAIYGVLVAFALLFPNFKLMLIFLPIPIAAKYFVPVLLLIDLTAGITGFSIFGANIAHFAHIGGAVAGSVLVMYWMKQSR